MTSFEIVERWARWSRTVWNRWAEEHGPHVMTDHDVALEKVKSYFWNARTIPGPEVVAGLGAAADFVSGMSDLDYETRHGLTSRLCIQTGLAAEAVENQRQNAKFSAIVKGAATTSIKGAATTSVRSSSVPLSHTPVGTFSCNASGDVWRPSGFGLTPAHERGNLRGQDPRLDSIVKRVLSVRAKGGRFEINDRGIFLADGYRQVV